jgi:site-specific DNA recombinase
MRILGYVRLSSLTEESTSPTRQREIIEKTCAARDWQLIDVIQDIDVSASKKRLDRPGIRELRERIKAGEADAVMVWRLDRIARSVVDFGTLLDDGMQIVSATEPLDLTSSMGRAMAEVLQVFAAMESANIGTRVAGAVKFMRQNGRFPGGIVPFAYWPAPNPNGPGRILRPHPPEAAIVREVADRIIEGESLTKIVADLDRRAVPTSRSALRLAEMAGRPTEGLDRGTWRLSGVRQVWTADYLLGRATENGELVRDSNGIPAQVFEPVLDLATLTRLRARLGNPRKSEAASTPRRTRAARLLSGVAHCAYCERRMYVGTANGKPTYRCPQGGPPGSCPGVRVNADVVEEFVVDRYLAVVGRNPEVEWVDEVTDPGTAADLAEAESAIQETLGALGSDDADVPSLMRRLEALKEHRAELRSRPATVRTTARPTGRTLAEAWAAQTDVDRRRALLLEGIDSVAVASAVARGNVFDAERVAINWLS